MKEINIAKTILLKRKEKKISKQFGEHHVIDGISFTVPEHCIFGFLGQNGAGKTTTMKMILEVLKPTSGNIYVCGEQVTYGETKTNRLIDYLPDVPEFYYYMTPKEYLRLCGEMSGMSRQQIKQKSEILLELVGLANVNRKIGGFSRGMKQRLGIAQALLNEPRILICDEPTSALDPIGRKEILDILLKVKEQTTVIFSTHILSDVERICDEVAVLQEGQLVLKGPLSELKAKGRKNQILITFKSEGLARQLKEPLELLSRVQMVSHQQEGLLIELTELEVGSLEVLRFLIQHNVGLHKYEVLEPTLESLFMEVVK